MKINTAPASTYLSLFFRAAKAVREASPLSEHRHLPFMHAIVLNALAEQSKVTMKDIASLLAVTPPSATAVITKLVKDGAIKRMAGTQDRRLISLALTARGRKLLDLHRLAHIQKMSEVLSKLTRQEKEQLASILKRIIDAYEKQN